jgi:hypothetical protein
VEKICESSSVTEELQEIGLTGVTQAKAKFRTNRRRLLQSGIQVLNTRFSHTITFRVTAACSLTDPASWLISELRVLVSSK